GRQSRRTARRRKAGFPGIDALRGFSDPQPATGIGGHISRRRARRARHPQPPRRRVMMKLLSRACLAMAVLALTGCAAPRSDVNYDAFRESKPASLLVLPPANLSVEPGASAAVLAQVTYPLAEA